QHKLYLNTPVAQIPRERNFDSTFALLRDGYAFTSKRCERLQANAFETRIMLQKVICAMGEEAATMFYRPGRFTRQHAMPLTTLVLLQDHGSAQLEEGAAHRRRKEMFMAMMKPERVAQLAMELETQWHGCIAHWMHKKEVILHCEAEELLCRAICQWAGLSITDEIVRRRARELSAMIEGTGAVGPRNWKGMLLRSRTERWARRIIADVRADRMRVSEGSPVSVIAHHRDEDGELLDVRSAAVELINLLRPTVAVARYVTFSALAMHQYPACRQRLQVGDEDYLEWFVQGVRRFYPFFPFVGGRVLEEFDWRGMHFAKGTWVILDLYGTNHDPRIWGDPEVFRPERFRDWNHSPFNFFPQGGGDFDLGHRYAGEWITIEMVKSAVRLLVSIDYDVPQQDLGFNLSRMPAIPESRFILRNVRRNEAANQSLRAVPVLRSVARRMH
ncbi:MAG TPA: cytochrome P450, partial [Armatimonadota bacterium]|nr:cytochrome P450 [Armatimonadota bacterium]